jgi:5-methylcytosine-specific restriction endonuclease McrA
MDRRTRWRHGKGRAYADACNEEVKAYQKTFAGRMALRVGGVNNAAKARGLDGRITGGALINLWALQNGIQEEAPVKCAACGVLASDWQIDHVVAVKNGGDNVPGNLQLLCADCHKEKTARDKDGYARRESSQLSLFGSDAKPADEKTA